MNFCRHHSPLDLKCSDAGEGGRSLAPPPPRRAARSGIALIITLIMLSVITFMAVTFLVLSQRERGSVSTTTDQSVATMAADAAVERAKAEAIAPMVAFRNPQLFDMAVSTNFINWHGYDKNAVDYRTNVNFQYYTNGGSLILSDFQRNLTNLLLNPRVPVYMTNRFRTNEWSYYLDLNRNGVPDPNGYLPVLNSNGQPMVVNGVTDYAWSYGDPEWIGVLEFPDRPYSKDNRFVSRYAYLVMPASRTLDVNYIYNQAITRDLTGGDGYFRNQGVGTWEINLPAFLTDLNTNVWTANQYQYNRAGNIGTANSGNSFLDARSFLAYRYNGNYNNLATAGFLFRNSGALTNDLVDQYSDGPLQTTLGAINDNDVVSRPWMGADNPNHFFSAQDFFDRVKLPGASSFVDRLNLATTNSLSSYDRDTYYRMLEQLGTGSSPERDKINVNWRNVTNGLVEPNLETALIPWTPNEFFTNAADRFLRTNTAVWIKEDFNAFTNTFGVTEPFTLTNIPVLVSTRFSSNGIPVTNNIFGYTPAVHRALQVVANIYDSTTNRAGSGYPYLPTVFRPIFRKIETNNTTRIFIVGYREVVNASMAISGAAPLMVDPQETDPSSPIARRLIPDLGVAISPSDRAEPMVMGVPLVIGAKKGFPSFNKFALENAIQLTRKLSFHRAQGRPVSQTNQIYILSITNSYGIQAWNSYSNAYPRQLWMTAVGDVLITLTNQLGQILDQTTGRPVSHHVVLFTNQNIGPNTWPGFVSSQSSVSFKVPILGGSNLLSTAAYLQSGIGGRFVPLTTNPWDPPNRFPIPKLGLRVRTTLRFILVDTLANRIVDYVNLDSTEPALDIMGLAKGDASMGGDLGTGSDPNPGVLWLTNRLNNPRGNAVPVDNPSIPTMGVWNQIQISMGLPTEVSEEFWKQYNATTLDKQQGIRNFNDRMYNNSGTTADNLSFETPFNPTRSFYQYVRWEANDPLVHYTVPDLRDLMGNKDPVEMDVRDKSPLRNLTGRNPLNEHYRPWGGNPNNPSETSGYPTKFNTAVKDPMVKQSDDWNFPTNKLPNIGVLGQIHRGSPWQTIYLKSNVATNEGWQRWSGNPNPTDAFWNRPASDRLLFDVFTAAPNENATRGQLSANQTQLAAWSAVLSGVPLVTNANGGWTLIQPAAFSTNVSWIVAGINGTRSSTNQQGRDVFPQKMFQHLGDVLAAPSLSDASPFLDRRNLATLSAGGISDAVYERIPQQILSLLTLDHAPRFAVYAYGQALRPAPQSLIPSGPLAGICTNYQVVAETATRTVFRVEFGTNNAPRIVTEQFNVLPPD